MEPQSQIPPILPPEPKNSHKFIFILLSVFILLMISWVAVIYQGSMDNKTISSSLVDGDWKTYRNEEYGFEFKYPGDLIITEDGNIGLLKILRVGDVNIMISNDKSKLEGEKYCGLLEGECYSYNEPCGTNNCHLYYHLQYIQEPIFFKSSVYKNSDLVIEFSQPFSRKDYKWFGMKLDEPIVKEWIKSGILEEGLFDEFDKIVSTFKFTEATTTLDISNWKTYRNEEYGFEFKYPADWLVKDAEGLVSLSSTENAEMMNHCKEFCEPNMTFSVYPNLQTLLEYYSISPTPKTLREYAIGASHSMPRFISVSGHEAFEFLMEDYFPHFTVLVDKEGFIYHISSKGAGFDETEKNIFSTFKFTR